MYQFNIYKPDGVDTVFWQDFIDLRSMIEQAIAEDTIFDQAHKLKDLLEQHINNKYLCIAARLYSWGVLSRLDISNYLQQYLTNQSLNQLSYWDLQELSGSLNTLKHHDLAALTKQFYLDNIADHNINLPVVERTVVYRPMGSGFFSVLEGLIFAQSTLRAHGIEMLVDDIEPWWVYPVPLKSILPKSFAYLSNYSHKNLENLKPHHIANLYHNQKTADVAFLPWLIINKKSIYQTIRQDIDQYLVTNYDNFTAKNTIAIFLRSGDKLSQEIIAFPNRLLEHDVQSLQTFNQPVFVCSDDFALAQSTAEKLGAVNLTSKHKTGYFAGNNVSDADIKEMLGFYSILANAQFIVGAAAVNLINAALWSSSMDLSYRYQLRTCAVRGYLNVCF